MKRAVKLVAATSSLAMAAAGTALITATAASASPNCSGWATLNGGGQVCIEYNSQGYEALWYQGSSTNNDHLDFNLDCPKPPPYGLAWGDYGAFKTPNTDTWYTFVFKVGDKGSCEVTIYDRDHPGQASSPDIPSGG